MKTCKHQNTRPSWDYCSCLDCGWINPSGPRDYRPNGGWFPSMEAFNEWKKYKTYPGMETVVPIVED